jgi:hypothetical protein
MRKTLVLTGVFVLFAAAAASAQQPAPPKPYKPVAVTLPAAVNDAGLTKLRAQLSDAAKKRDRAALAKLIVGKGFFWARNGGNAADKKKSGVDNLSITHGLTNTDGAGWDMLAGYAEDPTAAPSPVAKGALCAPADPGFDEKALRALLDATQSDLLEWAYPVADGAEVRATPQSGAPVIDKLGLYFVRLVPDNSPAAAVASYVRVATPSGKSGYVPADALAPIGNDQLCYLKEAGAWKIGGYIGAGDAQ